MCNVILPPKQIRSFWIDLAFFELLHDSECKQGWMLDDTAASPSYAHRSPSSCRIVSRLPRGESNQSYIMLTVEDGSDAIIAACFKCSSASRRAHRNQSSMHAPCRRLRAHWHTVAQSHTDLQSLSSWLGTSLLVILAVALDSTYLLGSKSAAMAPKRLQWMLI